MASRTQGASPLKRIRPVAIPRSPTNALNRPSTSNQQPQKRPLPCRGSTVSTRLSFLDRPIRNISVHLALHPAAVSLGPCAFEHLLHLWLRAVESAVVVAFLRCRAAHVVLHRRRCVVGTAGLDIGCEVGDGADGDVGSGVNGGRDDVIGLE